MAYTNVLRSVMRILQVHGRYQYAGGEEAVLADLMTMLAARGHEVQLFEANNAEMEAMPLWKQALVTLWNMRAYRRMRTEIRRFQPDVVHVHNTFPLLSPSVIVAARAEGVPVVMSVHNYRLGCVNGVLYRDGHACRQCVGRWMPWPGVVHGCYRESRSASAVVALMIALHRLIGSWREGVSCFVAPSVFVRQQLVAMGVDEARIQVIAHGVKEVEIRDLLESKSQRVEELKGHPHPADAKFATQTKLTHPSPLKGEEVKEMPYVLYVGRLSEEKGILLLMDAWARFSGKSRLQLVIVGDGPLKPEVEVLASAGPSVTYVGSLERDDVLRTMAAAQAVVVPSLCYESFSQVISEAYASGTGVIAAGHGALKERVEEGVTGVTFVPGEAASLQAMLELVVENPERFAAMGVKARERFEAHLGTEVHYRKLMEVYREVLASYE